MTWRSLWLRAWAAYRLWRWKPRYCGDCGVPLTPDETTNCAECIELAAAERERRVRWWQETVRAEGNAAAPQNAFGAYGLYASQDYGIAQSLYGGGGRLSDYLGNAYGQQIGPGSPSLSLLGQLGSAGAMFVPPKPPRRPHSLPPGTM